MRRLEPGPVFEDHLVYLLVGPGLALEYDEHPVLVLPRRMLLQDVEEAHTVPLLPEGQAELRPEDISHQFSVVPEGVLGVEIGVSGDGSWDC